MDQVAIDVDEEVAVLFVEGLEHGERVVRMSGRDRVCSCVEEGPAPTFAALGHLLRERGEGSSD